MASRTAYSTWTPHKPTLFDGHYLRNRSTLDIGVLGYIDIVQHKEHSPEVLSIPPGVLCIVIIQTAKPEYCAAEAVICRYATNDVVRSTTRSLALTWDSRV